MSGGRLFHNDNEHRRPKQNNENLFLETSWHTVHATEIEIDLSELSTRGKLSIPTS